jgi:Tfp pilus assembly protein PilF
MLLAAGCHTAINEAINPLAGQQEGKQGESELPLSDAARACLVTAQEMEQTGHDAEAIQLYERARQYNPKLSQCGRRLALLYERSGRFADARREYEQAIKTHPKDAELLNDYGYFQLQRGDLAPAEQTIRKSLDIKPKFQRAWGNLGLALAYQGRYDDAFQAFEKAAGPAEAHSNVGLILVQHGQPEAARKHLQEAIMLNAELEQPRRALAWLDKK